MFSSKSSTVNASTNFLGFVALETAKNMKDLAVFKKPFCSIKRAKSKILSEENYTEKIGEIIQRDFFPDLEKLKAQTEYIEALEHNDTKKMRELYEKYSFEQPRIERLASPATFETPVHTENINNDTSVPAIYKNIAIEAKKSKIEQKINLDEFLSNNTSEDNASFKEILIENEKKYRLKYAWLYKPESTPQIKTIESGKYQLLAIERNNKQRSNEVDTWNYKNKNYVMYIPDGVELTSEEKIELAKKRQEVIHPNTRLKVNPFNEQQNKETIDELAKALSKASDGKIGVDGKEIIRTETPRIDGYTILATPNPLPDKIMDSPIMTWGQIEGTPFRLDGGDTPMLHATQGCSFRMAEPPKREKIAMQLAEKAGEKKRDKKLRALNAARRSFTTPSPRSTIDRLSTMSPAAKRLATQKLRFSITPSPNRSSRTPVLQIKTPSTPSHIIPIVKINGIDTNLKLPMPVLTDNLLNLPQRQRAADFFNN